MTRAPPPEPRACRSGFGRQAHICGGAGRLPEARPLKLQQQEFKAKSEEISNYAFKLLQEREAAKKGVTVADLYRRNVTDGEALPPPKRFQRFSGDIATGSPTIKRQPGR